jgi:hypothetical protein
MRKLLMAALIGFSATPALALDCSDLKPLPPKDSTTSFVGKLDASVDGFFAKLAAVNSKVEGTYKEISKNVLAEFPSADKLYMWERVLFLECQLISEARDLSSAQKLDRIGDLYKLFDKPPPSVTNAATGNTATAIGNGNVINQGDNNTTTTGK